MNTTAKLILGAVATGCIAVGVAAQTGTIRPPGSTDAAGGQDAVEAQQVTASPVTSPSPSPEAAQETAPPPPVVEAGPPAKKKRHDH